MRLIPLGVNGYYPSHGRHTTCFLLIHDRDAILLDAGTGLARMGEPSVQHVLSECDALHVVLSHYHMDHVVGLFYLSALWSQGPVKLYGPSRPLVEGDVHDALDRLLSPPLSPKPAQELIAEIEVIPLCAPSAVIAGIDVRVWPQRHPGGSVGFRFGDELAYVTDRATDDAHVDEVRGVTLLLHELWLTDEEAAERPAMLEVHSRLADVAQLAAEAGVGHVMPMHHRPARTNDEVAALCRALEERSGRPVLVPEEGRVYPLPAP